MLENALGHIPCPCCSGTRWSRLFEKGRWRYVACDTCGTARLDPRPSEEDAAQLYGVDYFEGAAIGGYLDYDGEVGARTANARSHVRRVERLVDRPGRVLELGCASGWFLEAAARRGWEVAGVEVSAQMRARAASRLPPGTPLWASLSDAHGLFDVVVASQVLEHMIDPAAAVDAVAGLLAPGGSLLIETWDRRSWMARASGSHWQQITPPSVIWLFHRAGLAALLHRAGFTHVRARVAAKRVGVGSVLALIAGKAPRIGKPLSAIGRSDAVARLIVPYALGDLIVVTARRGP